MPRTKDQASQPDELIRWTTQWENAKAIENYTEILSEADRESLRQIDKFSNQIQQLFNIIKYIYITSLLIHVLLICISLYFVFNTNSSTFQVRFGTGGIIGYSIISLILIYKNPLKQARLLSADLLKMQVIFLSYLRQINQTDIFFKQIILTSGKLTTKQIQDTLAKVQEIAERILDDLNMLLEDISYFG